MKENLKLDLKVFILFICKVTFIYTYNYFILVLLLRLVGELRWLILNGGIEMDYK